jgi:hypothetical protein
MLPGCPSVPFSPYFFHRHRPRFLIKRLSWRFQSQKKHIGLVEREILVMKLGYYDFKNPPFMASRQLLITPIAAAGTSFSPLPCHAWHGSRATCAHRVEVEVGADGPASAPPAGATAATPPAGAIVTNLIRAFPSEGRTTRLRRHCNLARVLLRMYCTTSTFQYIVHTIKLNMLHDALSEFPRQTIYVGTMLRPLREP